METTVPKTSKPTVAGVLSIIAGVLTIMGALGVLVGLLFFIPFITSSVGPGPVPELSGWLVPGVLETLLVIAIVYFLIVGILPILGGIYAMQRRKWGLALTGTIAAIFGSTILGILALVFLVLAKDEFA